MMCLIAPTLPRPVSLPSLVESLNAEWRALRQGTVEGFIKFGESLLAARKKVGHGGFGKWVQANLEVGWRAARAFIHIAEWSAQNGSDTAILPPDWTALDRIAGLDEETFKELVADGTINPKAKQNEILGKIRQKRVQAKHEKISHEASLMAQLKIETHQFALIYADPPWVFEDKAGNHQSNTRSADNHYPVMSDEAIAGTLINGYTLSQIAAKDSVLQMWCTSSNLKRAMALMEAWGFEYKSHLMWDKETIGTGYLYRNQHEVLLYGTRGKPPQPIFLPPSVYREKSTEHSVKPAGVRTLIERMFPHYDEHCRLEMFARGAVPGWSVWGLEAVGAAA
jgi:N6-adenosine-specific RNA methylase IME4